MPATLSPEYLTPYEAADLLRISDRHLRKLTQENAVPHIRVSERCVRYPRSELLESMRGNGHAISDSNT